MKPIALLSDILDSALPFELPPELEASEPPEARGLARDEVRLMVSRYSDDRLLHARFRDLPAYIEPGDMLVINTSATLNAALPATRSNGSICELHLSTHLSDDMWSVELRIPFESGSAPLYDAGAGETLLLPAGATATLTAPYTRGNASHPSSRPDAALTTLTPTCQQGKGHHRLWLARLSLPTDQRDLLGWQDYLARYGSPIRYRYVPRSWPLSYYQTAYATEPGSAEMPSAGRAFTPELITRLVARGVIIAPLLLHTGVASLEEHEPPYAEYYRVPPETALQVNLAHETDRRVIAVGTTVVRALESVTDAQGITHPGEGWTELVITPQRGIRAIDAILTGLHEPRASHLAMLEALTGRSHLEITYREALKERYLWHEFGDLHLILP
jgi:S-adenosylmethionine:tRNA ribosyltransferase-isomerase